MRRPFDSRGGARVVLAAAALLALGWHAPARAADLPDPAIIGSTTALTGWEVGYVFDDVPNTDYASDAGGVGTFIDFDFGQPTTVTRVVFTDRLSSGSDNGSGARGDADNVTAFNLIFSDDTSFGDMGDVVVSASSPPCCDTVGVSIPGQVSKRYVRWQVTGISGGAPNIGASDFRFQAGRATATPVAGWAGLALLAAALTGGAVQTLRRRRA